jgi:hypothetical protein
VVLVELEAVVPVELEVVEQQLEKVMERIEVQELQDEKVRK